MNVSGNGRVQLNTREADALRATRLGREVKSNHPALPTMHQLGAVGLVEVTGFVSGHFPKPSATVFALTPKGLEALAVLDHEESLARMTDAARGDACPGCDEQRETGRRPPYGSHNQSCPFSE